MATYDPTILRQILQVKRPAPPQPPENKKFDSWAISSILADSLAALHSASASGLKEGIDVFTGQDASLSDLKRQYHESYGTGDILRDYDKLQGDASRLGGLPKWGARAIGLTGDIVADPLSWVGAPGAASFSKGGAKTIAKVAAAEGGGVLQALQVAIRRGGQLGTDASKMLERVEKSAAQIKRIEAAAPLSSADPLFGAASRELLAGRRAHEQLLVSVGKELDKSGVLSEVQHALSELSKRGGGASALVDDDISHVLIGPNTSGIRIRPAFIPGRLGEQGGFQIISAKRWERISRPFRTARGALAEKYSGTKVAKKLPFRSAMNQFLRERVAEHASNYDNETATQWLQLQAKMDLIRPQVLKHEEDFEQALKAIEAETPIDPNVREALFNAIQTPDGEWDEVGIPDLLKRMKVPTGATEQLRVLFARMQEISAFEGLDVKSLGHTYLPARLRDAVKRHGDWIDGRRVQPFEIRRLITPEYHGREIQTVKRDLITGVLEENPETGEIFVKSPTHPFNFASYSKELDEIALEVLGDVRSTKWERDPFRLMELYIKEWGRALEQRSIGRAFNDTGLGHWKRGYSDVDRLLSTANRVSPQLARAIEDAAKKVTSVYEEGLARVDGMNTSASTRPDLDITLPKEMGYRLPKHLLPPKAARKPIPDIYNPPPPPAVLHPDLQVAPEGQITSLPRSSTESPQLGPPLPKPEPPLLSVTEEESRALYGFDNRNEKIAGHPGTPHEGPPVQQIEPRLPIAAATPPQTAPTPRPPPTKGPSSPPPSRSLPQDLQNELLKIYRKLHKELTQFQKKSGVPDIAKTEITGLLRHVVEEVNTLVKGDVDLTQLEALYKRREEGVSRLLKQLEDESVTAENTAANITAKKEARVGANKLTALAGLALDLFEAINKAGASGLTKADADKAIKQLTQQLARANTDSKLLNEVTKAAGVGWGAIADTNNLLADVVGGLKQLHQKKIQKQEEVFWGNYTQKYFRKIPPIYLRESELSEIISIFGEIVDVQKKLGQTELTQSAEEILKDIELPEIFGKTQHGVAKKLGEMHPYELEIVRRRDQVERYYLGLLDDDIDIQHRTGRSLKTAGHTPSAKETPLAEFSPASQDEIRALHERLRGEGRTTPTVEELDRVMAPTESLDSVDDRLKNTTEPGWKLEDQPSLGESIDYVLRREIGKTEKRWHPEFWELHSTVSSQENWSTAVTGYYLLLLRRDAVEAAEVAIARGAPQQKLLEERLIPLLKEETAEMDEILQELIPPDLNEDEILPITAYVKILHRGIHNQMADIIDPNRHWATTKTIPESVSNYRELKLDTIEDWVDGVTPRQGELPLPVKRSGKTPPKTPPQKRNLTTPLSELLDEFGAEDVEGLLSPHLLHQAIARLTTIPRFAGEEVPRQALSRATARIPVSTIRTELYKISAKKFARNDQRVITLEEVHELLEPHYRKLDHDAMQINNTTATLTHNTNALKNLEDKKKMARKLKEHKLAVTKKNMEAYIDGDWLVSRDDLISSFSRLELRSDKALMKEVFYRADKISPSYLGDEHILPRSGYSISPQAGDRIAAALRSLDSQYAATKAPAPSPSAAQGELTLGIAKKEPLKKPPKIDKISTKERVLHSQLLQSRNRLSDLFHDALNRKGVLRGQPPPPKPPITAAEQLARRIKAIHPDSKERKIFEKLKAESTYASLLFAPEDAKLRGWMKHAQEVVNEYHIKHQNLPLDRLMHHLEEGVVDGIPIVPVRAKGLEDSFDSLGGWLIQMEQELEPLTAALEAHKQLGSPKHKTDLYSRMLAIRKNLTLAEMSEKKQTSLRLAEAKAEKVAEEAKQRPQLNLSEPLKQGDKPPPIPKIEENMRRERGLRPNETPAPVESPTTYRGRRPTLEERPPEQAELSLLDHMYTTTPRGAINARQAYDLMMGHPVHGYEQAAKLLDRWARTDVLQLSAKQLRDGKRQLPGVMFGGLFSERGYRADRFRYASGLVALDYDDIAKAGTTTQRALRAAETSGLVLMGYETAGRDGIRLILKTPWVRDNPDMYKAALMKAAETVSDIVRVPLDEGAASIAQHVGLSRGRVLPFYNQKATAVTQPINVTPPLPEKIPLPPHPPIASTSTKKITHRTKEELAKLSAESEKRPTPKYVSKLAKQKQTHPAPQRAKGPRGYDKISQNKLDDLLSYQDPSARASWLKTIWALIEGGYDESQIHGWSSQASNYSQKATNRTIEDYREGLSSFGWLVNEAKIQGYDVTTLWDDQALRKAPYRVPDKYLPGGKSTPPHYPGEKPPKKKVAPPDIQPVQRNFFQNATPEQLKQLERFEEEATLIMNTDMKLVSKVMVGEVGTKMAEWGDILTDPRNVEELAAAFRLQNLSDFRRHTEQLLSWWRGVVLVSPGYHVRNITSASFNNWLIGVKPSDYKRIIIDYRAFQKGHATRDKEVRSFLEESFRNAGISAGLFGAEIAQTGRGNWTQNPLSGFPIITDTTKQWWVVGKNREYGSNVESILRLAAGFRATRNMTPGTTSVGRQAHAKAIVDKLHFDYSDLSPLDRAIRNTTIPFWTFISRTFRLVAETALHRPQMLSTAEKLFNNIGGDAAYNPYAPEYYDTFAYKQATDNYWITTELPHLTVFSNLNQLQGPRATEVLTDTNPFVRSLFSFATGRQVGDGQPVTGSQRALKLADAAIPILPQLKSLLPTIIPGATEAQKANVWNKWLSFTGVPLRTPSAYEKQQQRNKQNPNRRRSTKRTPRLRSRHQ